MMNEEVSGGIGVQQKKGVLNILLIGNL